VAKRSVCRRWVQYGRGSARPEPASSDSASTLRQRDASASTADPGSQTPAPPHLVAATIASSRWSAAHLRMARFLPSHGRGLPTGLVHLRGRMHASLRRRLQGLQARGQWSVQGVRRKPPGVHLELRPPTDRKARASVPKPGEARLARPPSGLGPRPAAVRSEPGGCVCPSAELGAEVDSIAWLARGLVVSRHPPQMS